ncbi:MAG: DNA-processing protein DprA [Candidatus Omnitrophota bacterium]
MTNLQALVLLNMVADIGSVRAKKLLAAFGEPYRIFEADLHRVSSAGLSPILARRVVDAPRRLNVDQEIQAAARQGIRILTILDEAYPKSLKEIYDPPIVLYAKGEWLDADLNAIGVVGSRGASFYGLSCARDFSSQLSQWGLTIVSGMARGIDTAAHRAALDAGGRTIAVVGSGFDHIYPPENEHLFYEIADKGLVLSQFPLNMRPRPENFPIRNRIISGLSKGVLVVEASQKSGALITARFALEQGRDVFAIPGKLSSATSVGANDLIKQGARMVTHPQEILQELRPQLCLKERDLCSPQTQNLGRAGLPPMDESEAVIVRSLDDEPKYIDCLCAETGLKMKDLLAVLMRLELKGLIKQLPGKTFVRSL